MTMQTVSLDPLDLSAEQGLCALPTSTIEGRLADLIRAYAREGSAALAQSVVRHLEALCGHPDLRDAQRFCAYRRLAHHWRWLARGPLGAAPTQPPQDA